MEDSDNPYDILGVSSSATDQQIKSAYRKLALKHHPDKQKTEADREKATTLFAKISNAYETIGDAAQRAKYDRMKQAEAPYRKMPRQQSQHDVFHDIHFQDPFSVFERVFGEEFGTRRSRGQGFRSSSTKSVFDDPFFRDPFMRRSSHGDVFGDVMGGGLGGGFGGDPFFGGGLGGGMGSPFGGGGIGGDPFSSMHEQMNRMMDAHRSMMSPGFGDRRRSQPSQGTVTYTSSSLTGGNGRKSVSKSTTTRIINGKKQIVTEHIVTNPDGTVERKVDTSEDDGFRRLSPPQGTTRGYLGWEHEEGKKPNPAHKRKRRSSKQI